MPPKKQKKQSQSPAAKAKAETKPTTTPRAAAARAKAQVAQKATQQKAPSTSRRTRNEPVPRKAPARASRKRKSPSEGHASEGEELPAKKPKSTQAQAPKRVAKPTTSLRHAASAPQASAAPRALPVLNEAPTEPLAILVFGTGECSELGLGPQEKSATKPVLNPYLDPSDKSAFHVVQFACGGMHTVALTVDNKIITWGVNDLGALGRDTEWEGGMQEIDAEPDEEEEPLNPHESTPAEVSMRDVPKGTRFVQVAAGDSCSLALTDTGLVYGWGTFRDPNGNERFGTSKGGTLIEKQLTPTLIPDLQNITQITCGANHALALDKAGVVWAWGCGHQNQLGKRLVTRNDNKLKPCRVEIFRQKAQYIASGAYHSFARDRRGNVWSWGLNSFGQAGHLETAGENEALLPHPFKILGLSGKGVRAIDAGSQHSAAVTQDGECLVFGRMDGGQLGVKFTDEQLQDATHVIRDERGKPRICIKPTPVAGIGPVAAVACSTGHTIFVTASGAGYASGFGNGGQLGTGGEDDADTPQPLRGEHVRSRKLVVAGAGGQFSMVAAEAATSTG